MKHYIQFNWKRQRLGNAHHNHLAYETLPIF